jgi:SynChlorMet cassette radical SAM/SPASM protein ScmE
MSAARGSRRPSPSVSVMPSPRSVQISITGACNLKCRYCFYANEMAALADLPTSEWLRFFEELGRLGVMDVTLSGGEPFVRRDLFDLIDGLVTNRMRYAILSNGTLIDDTLLNRFETGKRRPRLNYIQISIDGSRAEIHDRNRPGSFARALHGLKRLKERGFPVQVRTTISRHNIDDLENIAHLLLEEIGLASFSTNEAAPLGTGCTNRAETALTPADQKKAMAVIDRLLARYPGRLQAQAGPQAKLKAYREMERARRTGEKRADWKMGFLSGCGCVFSKIEVLHDGTIVPCCMLPGLVLGNITRDSLGEIWLNHPTLQMLRERRNIAMSEVEGCRDCEWNEICNGSCPGLAHQLTGDVNRANPEDCYRNFINSVGGLDVLSD